MAKRKPSLTGLFDRTVPESQKDDLTEEERKEQKKKERRPIGVYLRKATRAEVEKIAEEEHLPVHGLLAYAISDFVRRYRKGQAKIETEKQTKLKLDL